MSKQFWIFLVIGIAVVAALLSGVLVTTKSAHLELTGNILKVRTMAMTNASLVIVDFRVTNPSGVPFVVKTAELRLDPASGDTLTGTAVSKYDVENVFKYQKLLGPKYNDVVGMRDQIPPGKTLDRMVAARFELPEDGVNRRKKLRLYLEDLDGVSAELTEK